VSGDNEGLIVGFRGKLDGLAEVVAQGQASVFLLEGLDQRVCSGNTGACCGWSLYLSLLSRMPFSNCCSAQGLALRH
jgi:hypothetical protein